MKPPKSAIDKVVNTDVTSLAKQRLAAVFNLRRLHSEMASEEAAHPSGNASTCEQLHQAQIGSLVFQRF